MTEIPKQLKNPPPFKTTRHYYDEEETMLSLVYREDENGKMHGYQEFWSECAPFYREKNLYIHGKKNGCIESLWLRGDSNLRFKGSFKNNCIHGEYKSWWPNCQPREISEWNNGVCMSIKRWNIDGSEDLDVEIKRECVCMNDVCEYDCLTGIPCDSKFESFFYLY